METDPFQYDKGDGLVVLRTCRAPTREAGSRRRISGTPSPAVPYPLPAQLHSACPFLILSGPAAAVR
jgi:hypothetical protein